MALPHYPYSSNQVREWNEIAHHKQMMDGYKHWMEENRDFDKAMEYLNVSSAFNSNKISFDGHRRMYRKLIIKKILGI